MNWREELRQAEKCCVLRHKQLRVLFKFPDEREILEEYNIDTGVCGRRHLKVERLTSGKHWTTEVGEPDFILLDDDDEVKESSNQPTIIRTTSKRNLEWKINNLPYPLEVYRLTVENNGKCLVVRTTNNKFFKKITAPDLDRLNLTLHQDQVSFTHKSNVLTIRYKKPQELVEFEKSVFDEVVNIPRMLTDFE